MPAEQRITQTLDRKQQWIECVTIAYEAWAALSDSQVHHQDSEHHCGIKPQAKDHESGYIQNVDLAFLERKCNFGLALMYFKSFLAPHTSSLLNPLSKYILSQFFFLTH